ncbi:MAG: hypothetical protein LBV28_03255 [Puniceicoccales bacterium]|jgi:hypothetical protein|nr:hypothetical protein [Puniceicoccales bacterium]
MAKKSQESTPPAPPAKKRPFHKRLSTRLALLTLLVLAVLTPWAAGRLLPTLAAANLKYTTSASLSVAENETSLLRGRLDWRGASLTNPVGFAEKRFITVNRLTLNFSPFDLLSGKHEFSDAVLDISEFVFVGKGSAPSQYASENNIAAFAHSLFPKPTAPTQAKAQFHIGKLKIKVERLLAIVGDGTGSPSTLADIGHALDLEFTDLNQDNIGAKVLPQLQEAISKHRNAIILANTPHMLLSETAAQIGNVAEGVATVGVAAVDAVQGTAGAVIGLFSSGKTEEDEADEKVATFFKSLFKKP